MSRPVVIVLIVMIGLIGLAVAVPRLAGPYRIAWLTDNTCALPCWRGITPGVTPFDDAERRLRAMPDVDSDSIRPYRNEPGYPLSFNLISSDDEIQVELDGVDNQVRSIFFYPVNGTLSLSNLVAQIGSPSGMSGLFVSTRYLVTYREPHVLAIIERTPASSNCNPRLRVPIFLNLGDYELKYQVSDWHGFTSVFDTICYGN